MSDYLLNLQKSMMYVNDDTMIDVNDDTMTPHGTMIDRHDITHICITCSDTIDTQRQIITNEIRIAPYKVTHSNFMTHYIFNSTNQVRTYNERVTQQ